MAKVLNLLSHGAHPKPFTNIPNYHLATPSLHGPPHQSDHAVEKHWIKPSPAWQVYSPVHGIPRPMPIAPSLQDACLGGSRRRLHFRHGGPSR